MDGDGAAAMRYTEARLSKIAMEMLSDISKNTVDFALNFDESEKEPTVLPARFPNLLANGTTGIAVGMATNIPPHNLNELIRAVKRIIEDRIEERETDISDVLSIIRGPDFPTGGNILGRQGIEDAYRTGRGKIRIRAVTQIEPMANGKNRIVVTEIPYLVNKARLIEKIAELVKDKRVDGITDLRDESNREGMRIVIELRKDVSPDVILNRLYKHTQMQDTFGVNMLALVNNEPRTLNILQMLTYYLEHQKEVVRRRTEYDLEKAKERAHILEGLLKALDAVEEIIKIIRGSQNVSQAKSNLMERFSFSDLQAQAIVDMRFRALTGLERDRLMKEYEELLEKITYFKEILESPVWLLTVIKEELIQIGERFGDERRTGFIADDDFTDEDLIPEEDTVIAFTNLGYIKRMSPDNFKAQNRGGKGIKGMQTIDEDFIADILMTSTHSDVNFFTNMGRLYRIRAHRIQEAGRNARGNAIINLIPLLPEEKISAIIATKEYDSDKFLLMATRQGMVKKTPVSEYEHVRKNGIIAIALKEGDELIEVKPTNGSEDIFAVTKKGQCLRFSEKEVRITGRKSIGVIGMRLKGKDEVIGVQVISQGESLLLVSEYGMGKRTLAEEFSNHHRGGMGTKCYKVTEKTGQLVGFKLVNEEREIFIITNEGIIIRLEVGKISCIGRDTSGVKLMDIDRDKDIRVASIAKVRESREDKEMQEEGIAETEEASEREEETP